MTIIPLFEFRKIIPRWRDSRIALLTGELISSNRLHHKNNAGHELFHKKLELWNEQGLIEFAAEVVSGAISQGLYNEAIDAAEFLVSERGKSTPAVISIANEILVRTGIKSKEDINTGKLGEIDHYTISTRIHHLRNLLNKYPRNALLWADLSLFYIMLGQAQQSKDAMNVAIILAPDNRFVLRSATRMFIHLDEPDRAHKLLIDRPVTRQDPWLLAAEIATAGVANRTPMLVHAGKDILERKKFSAFHTAELASALATLELSSGTSRKARKLFQLSLVDPTENSIAQSVWAKKQIQFLDTDSVLQKTPRTYEARAMSALRDLNWEETVQESQLWLVDEFFSSRPAEVGSYAALIGLENYPLAEKLIKTALIANPDDLTLINNLAFSIASQDRIWEARKVLDDALLQIENSNENVPIKATMGLIKIRSGEIDAGKALYHEAISLAQHRSKFEQAALASIYYAREMLLAGMLTKTEAITIAEDAAISQPHPHIIWLLEKVKTIPSVIV